MRDVGDENETVEINGPKYTSREESNDHRKKNVKSYADVVRGD